MKIVLDEKYCAGADKSVEAFYRAFMGFNGATLSGAKTLALMSASDKDIAAGFKVYKDVKKAVSKDAIDKEMELTIKLNEKGDNMAKAINSCISTMKVDRLQVARVRATLTGAVVEIAEANGMELLGDMNYKPVAFFDYSKKKGKKVHFESKEIDEKVFDIVSAVLADYKEAKIDGSKDREQDVHKASEKTAQEKLTKYIGQLKLVKEMNDLY